MFRKKLSILAMVVLLVLAVALVGCSDKDKEEFDAAFEATGYQGTLEDGSTLIFFKMNDDTMIIAITDATHQGETALTYTGKPVQGDDNKTTRPPSTPAFVYELSRPPALTRCFRMGIPLAKQTRGRA